MERSGRLVMMLLLILGFIVPAASIATEVTSSVTGLIAMTEADEDQEYYDYEDEEAAGDVTYQSEPEEEADEEEEPLLEGEEPDFYDYEEDPEA
jgi:hypothetical protein